VSKPLDPSGACGIDFGTSNSTAGWSQLGQSAQHSKLLALEDGKLTLPSLVFYHAEDGHVSYPKGLVADQRHAPRSAR